MALRRKDVRKHLSLLAALFVLAVTVSAQSNRRQLTGHVRAFANAANDRGRMEATRKLQRVTLVLEPTAAQQADLAALMASQQDPASPNFHHWLTADEYAARFGVSQAAIDQITSWLISQNLTVESVSRGRTTIAFSGNVRDVERALQTEIHYYTANGETHFANASDPSVPNSISPYIGVIRGLDDVRLKPRSVPAAPPDPKLPNYTSVTTGAHYLAPNDVATIYNVAALHNSGITGKGQKIVVVGQTKINLSDVQAFRTYFNLPANDPTLMLVPGTTDPGVVSGDDLTEADLDVEWAGAMARDAQIIYIYAPFVETALGYAINQNLAPVISMSYGLCEALSGFNDLKSLNSYANQAAVLGISWIAAAGDNGANDCFQQASNAPSGLSVDAPASVPGVTGIGGTTLTEGGGTYWNTSNSANHASAISYIPESVWNDGDADSGGGGASTYFQKPSWQAGNGVPNDSLRDVPDISMPASPDHDPYLVYSGGLLKGVGGTSVGAPVFAGIAGLLNHYLAANALKGPAGLLNPGIYALAASAPGAFHDITNGNNNVSSCSGRGCVPTQIGYDAAPGYDLTSGWGTVNAFNLVTAWGSVNSGVSKSAATVQLASSVASLGAGDSVTFTATVSGSSTAAPTGTVTFYSGGVSLGSGTIASAIAKLTVTGAQLIANAPEATIGGYAPVVTAIYNGDGVYGVASVNAAISVTAPGVMVIKSITSAASFQAAYAPGMIVSLFGQNLSGSTPNAPTAPLPTQLGGTSVTVNGIPAPLYFVSPTQINLQIPWEIPKLTTAIFIVTSNGQSATWQATTSANAPEVFGDVNSLMVPYQATGRGQTVFLFATGDGLFAPPSVTTGAVPPSGTLSTVATNVKVTVGGVLANATFVGEPSWSVGVSQINFTIPPSAPLGQQPVIVTVGTAASAPVFITVTQ